MTITKDVRAAEFLFLSALRQECREYKLWMPVAVERHALALFTQQLHSPIPEEITAYLEKMHFNMPSGKIPRYRHLRKLGDAIVSYLEYAPQRGQEAVTPRFYCALAQNYYGDAAGIGKALRHPYAPVLETIADKLDVYVPVLRDTLCRLVA
jgi:hypothetical protein